ncbi:MAG: NADH-quinone oxidoreductase subunit NuoK [Planctomycetota bacterium]
MAPEHALVVSAILFGIGVAGVLARRNLLVIFMSIELMLNAAGLAFVAFALRNAAVTRASIELPATTDGAAAIESLAQVTPRVMEVAGIGHGTAFLGAAVAAAEAAIGLAVILLVYRSRREVDADKTDLLRG